MTGGEPSVSGLVPLAERVGVIHCFRLALVVIAVGSAALWPETIGAEVGDLAFITAGYVLVTVATEVGRHRSGKRGLPVIGGLLLVDGLWLSLVVHKTGGPGEVLSSMIVLHVVAVTLVASYRTGLKIAVWHSLLLVAWYVIAKAEWGFRAADTGARSEVVAGVVAVLLFAVGTAVFSGLNERELRRTRLELGDLAAMGSELQDIRAPEDIEQAVLSRVQITFGFPRAALIVGNERSLHHMWVAGDGPAPDGMRRVPPARHGLAGRPPDGILRWCWHNRAPHLARKMEPSWAALSQALPGAHNVVIAPMVADRDTVGALVLERGGGPQLGFSRARLHAVMEFATHGALSIRNSVLMAEVERLARVDELTGLANRRAFEDTLSREVERASRSGEDLSVVMLDVDHFKRLNDTYGHQMGDEVLRRVGKALASRVRQVDLPARYGGEEFIVVLPACSAGDAIRVAEQVREAIASETGELDEAGLSVSASAGVATLPVSAGTAEDLVSAADEALYQSKEGGRDRVTLSKRDTTGSKALAGASAR